MKLYVASSWRNPRQPEIVEALRAAGHEAYDFRNPPSGSGFSWSQIDPAWASWSVSAYARALEHEIAQAGFDSDFNAMKWADAGVLVLGSGRSAHLEAGYFVGAHKPLVVILDENEFKDGAGHSVIELMYKMANAIVVNVDQAITFLAGADIGYPLEQEIAELRALFEMQWRRSREATTLWQLGNPGNDLVWPDLGDLLTWLMSKIPTELCQAPAGTYDGVTGKRPRCPVPCPHAVTP